MGVEFSLGLATASLPSLRPIITWQGVRPFTSEGSHGPGVGTHSKSRRNPRSSGYTQDCPMGIELSVSKNQTIIKTSIVDVELGASESTERIITT